MIIHRRLIHSIEFHDAIHGFRTKRGTSTAIINVKLIMQLAKRNKHPLYMIFLDIKKAYDTLDRQRAINLLRKYGLGDKICNLIGKMWEDDTIVPKQQMFYGTPFKAERGVRQGDIISPTIFNIVIDSIVRDCMHKLEEINDKDTTIQFYADDGLIGGKNYETVQFMMDVITKSCLSFGLEMNEVKTESMIMKAKRKQQNMSEYAYNKRINGIGLSSEEMKKGSTKCSCCEKIVQQGSLKAHQLSYQCIKIRKEKEKKEALVTDHNQPLVDNNIEETNPY